MNSTASTSASRFFVDAPTARLAVAQDGPPDHPIVLLHGGPGVPDYLEPVADILARAHRVIRFDQRGVGDSVAYRDQYDPEDYLDDIEAVRHHSGHERVGLFGHSWGGTLAQLYATRFPDRVSKLFLSNSGIGFGADWKAMERAVMAYNRRVSGLAGFTLLGLNQLAAMLPGRLGDRGARRMMVRVWRNYFQPPETAPLPAGSWLDGIKSRAIFRTRAAAVSAAATGIDGRALRPGTPVLILFGPADIYGPTTARLRKRFPSATHVILERSGHVPWLQNPPAFREHLCAFFGC